MSRPRMVFAAFLVSLAAVVLPAVAAQAAPDRPSHVVIIVLDQARADTIQRYHMKNVQELQRKGTSFPNGIVGDMAAETVISHNVITSGLFPKNMGWSTEIYRDQNNVLLAGAGKYHVTSSMACSDYDLLINNGGYRKLQDYLDLKFGETSSFASISQKRSSACTAGHVSGVDGTPSDTEDVIFQIRGSRKTCGTVASPEPQWRQPENGNGLLTDLPPWLDVTTGSCNNRWWTNQDPVNLSYGTNVMSPANIYPLEGNRFVPGFDSAHIGGDNWSADAAIEEINHDPAWRGMMVSLGGIDKMGHMWGPEDRGEKGAEPGSIEEMRHMPFVAKNADKQVGRIVDALDDRGILDETLIVITADHAAQTGNPFFGVLAPGVANPQCPNKPPSTGILSDCNWYYGDEDNAREDEAYLDPSPAVKALRDRLGGNLAFSYQDTHIAAYLNTDRSLAAKREAAQAVLDMPGVVASYYINAAQDDYTRFGTNRMTGRERKWFNDHTDELVDTMANSSAPDVVGITATDVTYGVKGDHGGSQEIVQNIPMVFYGPGVGQRDQRREFRHVDILPTILDAMGIPYNPSQLDGEAVSLSKK
jgi:Sulfatase/Type I phosphodiesterase / nucleotide pyrophosphatase